MLSSRKIFIFLTGLILWLSGGCSLFSPSSPELILPEGDCALGIPVPCDLVIARKGFTTGYSNAERQALWVSYLLTAENLNKKPFPRTNNFKQDPLVEVLPVMPQEYSGSGFDRGHLAPANDMAYSAETMENSFYMSNISPQTPGFNRLHWLEAEKKVRRWALRERKLYVITGPYFGESKNSVGKSGITVPEGFFKAVFDMTPPYKMIAIYIPNRDSGGEKILSVDELEALTGYDFFDQMDDEWEEVLEKNSDISVWQ